MHRASDFAEYLSSRDASAADPRELLTLARMRDALGTPLTQSDYERLRDVLRLHAERTDEQQRASARDGFANADGTLSRR